MYLLFLLQCFFLFSWVYIITNNLQGHLLISVAKFLLVSWSHEFSRLVCTSSRAKWWHVEDRLTERGNFKFKSLGRMLNIFFQGIKGFYTNFPEVTRWNKHLKKTGNYIEQILIYNSLFLNTCPYFNWCILQAFAQMEINMKLYLMLKFQFWNFREWYFFIVITPRFTLTLNGQSKPEKVQSMDEIDLFKNY